MKSKDFLFARKYYRIFNYGNGDEHVFKSGRNYEYFLKKLRERMTPHWELVAWCLLPDCFELVVKMKEPLEEGISWEEVNKRTCFQFGQYIHGYTKAINKYHQRRGSLFARSFSRKLISDDYEMKKIICSMHKAPVERGYVASPFQWRFSSCMYAHLYRQSIQFREMIHPFGSLENFLTEHQLSEKSV